MKERKLLIGAPVLLLALVFAVMFTSCEEPEETYEVYRFDWTYTAFSQSFNVSLNVNYFYRTSITNSQYTQLVALCQQYNVKSEELTEDQIETWLKGLGLSDTQADDVSGKCIDYEHYFFGMRVNSTTVKVLFK